ncbi:MAG: cytochrome c [Holophagaceae bacterium]|nr:cytochrome c [Holophagaceae bacterium]
MDRPKTERSQARPKKDPQQEWTESHPAEGLPVKTGTDQDKVDGKLLSMDFAPPMATGDTLAGVASAAKIMGIKNYVPVTGWQTVYFGSNHQVAPKDKALNCYNCHAPNGVLNFQELGYTSKEIKRLTSPERYFNKMAEKMREEW